jgi:hypothetical protein
LKMSFGLPRPLYLAHATYPQWAALQDTIREREKSRKLLNRHERCRARAIVAEHMWTSHAMTRALWAHIQNVVALLWTANKNTNKRGIPGGYRGWCAVGTKTKYSSSSMYTKKYRPGRVWVFSRKQYSAENLCEMVTHRPCHTDGARQPHHEHISRPRGGFCKVLRVNKPLAAVSAWQRACRLPTSTARRNNNGISHHKQRTNRGQALICACAHYSTIPSLILKEELRSYTLVQPKRVEPESTVASKLSRPNLLPLMGPGLQLLSQRANKATAL